MLRTTISTPSLANVVSCCCCRRLPPLGLPLLIALCSPCRLEHARQRTTQRVPWHPSCGGLWIPPSREASRKPTMAWETALRANSDPRPVRPGSDHGVSPFPPSQCRSSRRDSVCSTIHPLVGSQTPGINSVRCSHQQNQVNHPRSTRRHRTHLFGPAVSYHISTGSQVRQSIWDKQSAAQCWCASSRYPHEFLQRGQRMPFQLCACRMPRGLQPPALRFPSHPEVMAI
mmetsp:Transcript_29473/g.67907  ORF Transcript_29473/g.67907 Transcript_29473/m.67907 type:complete len:229 (-) Transcript_29473:1009-1695(-)